MLDTGESDPQMSAVRPGGGRAQDELGRWDSPATQMTKHKAFQGWSCIWTPFSSFPLTTPSSRYLPGIQQAVLLESLLYRIQVVGFPVWDTAAVLSFIYFSTFVTFPRAYRGYQREAGRQKHPV